MGEGDYVGFFFFRMRCGSDIIVKGDFGRLRIRLYSCEVLGRDVFLRIVSCFFYRSGFGLVFIYFRKEGGVK